MLQSIENKGFRWATVILIAVLWAGVVAPSSARAAKDTNIRILVTDASTGKPIFQAHLTLLFVVSRRFRPDKSYSLSAKTDMKGICHFKDIPMGKIRLYVIATDHQTFGQEFEVTEQNQLIHVKMKKPQPQV